MLKRSELIEPGAITRLYDVPVQEVIMALSKRKLPSRMHADGLVYVDLPGLAEAADALNWKKRDLPSERGAA